MNPAGPPAAPPTPLPSPPSRATPWVLAALAAALYARTLGNGLVNWDDPRYVPGNPFATRGLAGIPAAWTSSFDDAYYPLTHTLYCSIQQVAGPSPFAHHLVQVALWAGAVALVPAALAAFRVPRAVGFWAAVLWAFHPLRVESVSWAANLKDTLSVVLVLGSFALYGRGRRWGSAAVFLLAMLAKSMVFPVAGVFFLLAWRDGRRLRDAAVRALPWLVPAIAVAALGAALHLGEPDRTVPGGHLLAALPSVLWLPWWYVFRTLVPLPSRAIYTFVAVGPFDVRLFVAVGLWAVVAGWVRRGGGTVRDRLLAVGAAWLPFAAVTGLVPLLVPVADRYALLPSLAVTTLAILAVERARTRWPRAADLAPPALAAAAGALAAVALARQGAWKDGASLWQADRERDPFSVPARIGLAGAHGEARRWHDVVRELEVIARLGGERARATGEPSIGLSRAELHETLRQGKAGTRVLLDVGGTALKENEPAAALAALEASILVNETAAGRALAAQAASRLGRPSEALVHAERAIDLDPAREDAVVARALALADLRRYAEALAATDARLDDPKQAALLRAVRALALSKLGREAEARRLLAELRLPASAI